MTKEEVTRAVRHAVDVQLSAEPSGGMEAAVRILQAVLHDADLAEQLVALLYRDIADLSALASITALSDLGLLPQSLSE